MGAAQGPGIGGIGDAAVTNPASDATVIAALKGLLSLLASGITISPGDIEIGAVEIKDATTSNRAGVTAGGGLSVSLIDYTPGQTTKTGSLSVTVASDQGSLLVSGTVVVNGSGISHDSPVAGVPPALIGGYAKATAPADVNADGDAVIGWYLRNGAMCVNITAAGALIAGDVSNGLDVDVTRLPSLVAGTATIGATKDAGPNWTPSRANLSSADASSAADLSAAPTSGQKIVLDDWWFSTDTALRIDLIEETSGTVVWSAYMAANSQVQYTPRDGLKLDTADKKLRRQTSAAGNVRGTLNYHSEA